MTESPESDWQSEAVETQNRFCDLLGGEYDSFGENNEFYIKKNIGFSIFGTPSETAPTKKNCFIGYNADQRETINKICKKIVELSRSNNKIKIGFLYVICRLKNKYIMEEPVFKIAIDGEKICFVDTHSRVYTDWDHYLSTNELPRCQMCYPKNGQYTCLDNCVEVSFGKSPACKLSHRILSGLDTAGTVVSVAAVATTFVASAPMAVVVGATAATIGTGVYTTARSIGNLVDRHEHGESIKLSDKEARAEIINIVGSTAGCVAGGVTRVTQKALASGRTVGKAGMLFTKGLNWSSAAVSAASILDTSKQMYDKRLESEPLTKRDFFILSCEVMFFAAACHNIRNTNNMMSDLNSSNISALENKIVEKTKLSKTQKRNLRKRNAKARNRGEVAGQSHELNRPSPRYTRKVDHWDLLNKFASICPRFESINNKGCNICHDYQQMCEDKMTLEKFLNYTSIILKELYDEFKEDVEDGVQLIHDLFKHQSFRESYKKGFFEEAASDEFFSYMLWDNIFQVEREIDGCYDLAHTSNDDDICTMDWMLADIYDLTLELLSINFSSSSKNAFCICLHAVCVEVVKEVNIRIKKYNSELQNAKEKLREKFQHKQFDHAYGVSEDIGKFMFKAALRSVDVRLASLITPEIAARQYTGVHLWESIKDETISLYLRKSDRMPDIAKYLKWMSDIAPSDCYVLKSDEIPMYFSKKNCEIKGDIKKVCIIKPHEQLGLKIEAFIFRTFEDKSLVTLITMMKSNINISTIKKN